jgi:uncharacterized protein YjiS (DUF1127 family)
MSPLTMTGSVPAISRTLVQAREARVLNRVWLLLKVWQERRALSRLDDRALHDLGLSHADVEHEVSRSPFDVPRDRA